MLPPELALRSATVAILVLTGVVILRDRRHRSTGPYGGLLALSVAADSIVSIAGRAFALPLHRILRMLDAQNIQLVSGRKLAVVDGRAVPVSDLVALLGLPSTDRGPWVLLGTTADAHAFQVETVLQKRDVVVRGLTGRLRDLKAISGASIEPNG